MAKEDYTKYTQVLGIHLTVVSATQISFDALNRDETSYIYDDKGTGHFGDFQHQFDFQVDDADYGWALLWGLINVIPPGWDAPRLFLYATGENYVGHMPIELQSWDGVDNNRDVGDILFGTHYWCTVKRVGNTLTCDLYLDAERTNKDDTLTVVCLTDTLRYVYAIRSLDDNHATWFITGDIYNLDLQEVGLPMGLGLKPGMKGGIGRPPLGTGGASFGG